MANLNTEKLQTGKNYVLLVTRGYPSSKYPTNGIFEFDQAKSLVENNVKIVYLAIDVRSIRRFRKWGFESLVKDGVRIESVNIPCGALPIQIINIVREVGFLLLMRKVCKKYGDPTIIHAHFIDFGFIVAKHYKKEILPLVLTEHHSEMNQNSISKYFYKLGSFTYPKMSKVLTVSSHLSQNINRIFCIDSKVVPNIVDINSFKFEPQIPNQAKFVIVSVGNLTKNKRMDLLVNAFFNAFSKEDNAYLFIYGDGPEFHSLDKTISNLNQCERVFLMGRADRSVIAEQMKRSDCFALVSKLETFGVAYIEAMAMGLPIIASKCGGPEDFVNPENGILVLSDSIDDISNSLRLMKENILKFDKSSIFLATKNRFSPDKIAGTLIEIYSELWRIYE